MTSALYLLPDGALTGCAVGATLVLDGDEGHHAVTVKRAQVGEQLLLADGSGMQAVVEVRALAAGALEAVVLDLVDARAPGPRFVLAQALAKNGRDEQAVETATELGVDEVLAWQARRSIVQWRGERGRKSLAKWGGIARAAAKQARRADVPAVAGPFDSRALAERLAEVVEAGGVALVLHEDASTRLDEVALPAAGDVALVVGPEGGIDPGELDAFADAGARVVRLGPTVLRASSAGPAALAVLLAATRWRLDPTGGR